MLYSEFTILFLGVLIIILIIHFEERNIKFMKKIIITKKNKLEEEILNL